MAFRALVVAVVIALSGCDGSDEKDSSATATTTAPETPVIVETAEEPTAEEPTADSSEEDCAALLADEKGAGDCVLGEGKARISAAARGTAFGDLAIRIKSVRLARSIPAGFDGGTESRTNGRFVILRVNVRNRGNRPLDWSNLLDGRTQLLVGDKTFDHNGDAERNLPGGLDDVGTSIPPDGSRDQWLVYEVTRPSVKDIRDGFLAFVTTADLEGGLDPSTTSKVGFVRIPG